MKIRVLAVMLTIMLLLTACTGSVRGRMEAVEESVENKLETFEDAVENRVDEAEDAVEQALTPQTTQPAPTQSAAQTVTQPASAPAGTLTSEQAQAIALEHAGLSADQVTYLRADYEVDDGVAQYEVQFHEGRWEYDYEIHAETGEILSYDRDD